MPRWKRRLAEAESALRQQVLATRLLREQARLDRWYCKMSRAQCPQPSEAWDCLGTPLLGHSTLCPRSQPHGFLAWVFGGRGCPTDRLHVAWVGRCAFAFSRRAPPPISIPFPVGATDPQTADSNIRNVSQSQPQGTKNGGRASSGVSSPHLVALSDILLAAPISLPEAVVADTGAMAAIRGCVKALDQAAKGHALDAPVAVDPANGITATVSSWPQSATQKNRLAWPQTELGTDGVVIAVLRELCHFHPRVDHPVPNWDAFGPPAKFRTMQQAAPCCMPCALHPGVQLPDIYEALCIPPEWHTVRAVQNLLIHTDRSLALSVPGAVGCLPVSLGPSPNGGDNYDEAEAAARWVPLFGLGGKDEFVSHTTLVYLADLAAPAGARLNAPLPQKGLSGQDIARLSTGLQTRRNALGKVVCRALLTAGANCWMDGPRHVHRAGRVKERERARDHVEQQALMDLADEEGWDSATRDDGSQFHLRDIFADATTPMPRV